MQTAILPYTITQTVNEYVSKLSRILTKSPANWVTPMINNEMKMRDLCSEQPQMTVQTKNVILKE